MSFTIHHASPGFFTWHSVLHEQLEKAVPKFCLLHIGQRKLYGHVQRQCGRHNSWRTDIEKCEQIRLLLQTICLGIFVDFFCILFSKPRRSSGALPAGLCSDPVFRRRVFVQSRHPLRAGGRGCDGWLSGSEPGTPHASRYLQSA